MTATSRRLAHGQRIVRRCLQMTAAAVVASGVFLHRLLAARAGRDAGWHALGRALVRLATMLGATFIKVGQIASTRADILPAALVHELTTLQDRVPACSFGDVRRTIEAELGQPLERVFERFEKEPVAAASVAQVHRAILRDTGDVVAVKVRRPNVRERIALDRSILLFAARVLERVIPSLRLISFEEAMRHFCDAVEEQADLRLEAANNHRFTENFAADAEVDFPRLFPQACAEGVLTMEFIEGVRENDIDGTEIDVHRVVQAGMRCVCRMIFSHGFVHADLHAGNLRFFAPSRVVLLDLGLVGRLSDTDRVSAAELLFAFATGDGRTVARLFHDNASYKATTDYGAYEREIIGLVDGVQQRGMANIQITLEIGRLFDVLRRHHIRARSHMTMVNLALMTAEGLGKRLAPELSLTDEAIPYLAEALGPSRAVSQS
jgi:ubiquinone biosynthesis protein